MSVPYNKRMAYKARLKSPGKALQADYKASRKAAIHLFCLQCTGLDRKAIAECTALDCPLWQYRLMPTGSEKPPIPKNAIVPKGQLNAKKRKLSPKTLDDLADELNI